MQFPEEFKLNLGDSAGMQLRGGWELISWAEKELEGS